ncbi:hypothetical protein CFC21_007484 [Triticum aestivum]|uniref:Bowman-Birk serine protease inhibitors family domain-containing protein n=2 Tax=Triticum aestivum TaxID=4565 RepID=A0A9R1IRE9_WHEAT|nr:uncharacterized protein LOC123093109 [Triticum aestivum]KAF6990275.1 hypothetical protein CFC21_007484 [Triticum aestivum]
MKNTKLVAILVLQAILVMGILAHVNANYFPICCNECRSFSGVVICDDAHPQCPKGCSTCRPVQTGSVKMLQCADMRSTINGTRDPRCKKN